MKYVPKFPQRRQKNYNKPIRSLTEPTLYLGPRRLQTNALTYKETAKTQYIINKGSNNNPTRSHNC